ncbi:MAG: ABC transporter substrate-binding protein [Selenomonadaceae bacterium]|nr:ABC transporter substrate-binding protein [Selenomonadaceae bacterium]
MLKKIFTATLLLLMLLMTGCGGGDKPADTGDKKTNKPGSKLVIYTSMKESLIGGIVEGFKAKYPDIDVDWQSAGAGKIMAKLEAERQSGHLMADIIWTSEVPDFYQMKNEGLLEQYKPIVFDELLNPFDDYDGSFTAARLGTLGIVINTDKVTTEPTSWETIATDATYKDSFGIADPALSGTAFMSIALLEKQFGWDYIVRLHDNGATKSKGSGRVVDDTADGVLNACLGVDYITAGKIDKGAPLKMVYPHELLMVPSPVAIFKDAEHKDNAKKFVDYLLTQEAQQKVAEAGTVPVRRDVKMPERYNLPNPEDALANGIKINYSDVLDKKDDTIKKFSNLFK